MANKEHFEELSKGFESWNKYVKAQSENFSPDFSDLGFFLRDHSKVNLSNANLEAAQAKDSKFIQADFTNANLRHLDAQGANFSKADFTDANLKFATIHNSDLQGANFLWANLEGTDLEGSTYDETTTWPKGFNPKAAGAILEKKKTAESAAYDTSGKKITPNPKKEIISKTRERDQGTQPKHTSGLG